MFFLDPKNDVAFKKIFGDESRKHLTIAALNDFLEKKEGELIEDITFLDTANLPDFIDGKKSFVDVRCVFGVGSIPRMTTASGQAGAIFPHLAHSAH